MKRLLIIAVVLGIVAAACSGAAPAIVNGTPITEAELEGLSSQGAVPQEQLLGDLFSLISTKVAMEAAADEFGIEVTDEDRAAELAQIEDAVAAQGTTIQEILDQRGRTDAWVDLIVDQTVLGRKVSEQLLAAADPISDAEVEEAFAARRLDTATVCARHILVETEEEAQAALERAEAGEDFGELAQELSTGPSGPNGGDLGCGAPGGYVQPFADATMEAEIGVPFGPVQTDFGWHVILVESRDEPTLDEVAPQIRAELDAARTNELYSDWLTEHLRAADVSIAPEYGTWTVPDAEGAVPSITPPTN